MSDTKTQKRPIAVLASNHAQFCLYLREHNLDFRDAIFVNSWVKIIGREFSAVVTIGTWYENPDHQELKKMAELRVVNAKP